MCLNTWLCCWGGGSLGLSNQVLPHQSHNSVSLFVLFQKMKLRITSRGPPLWQSCYHCLLIQKTCFRQCFDWMNKWSGDSLKVANPRKHEFLFRLAVTLLCFEFLLTRNVAYKRTTHLMLWLCEPFACRCPGSNEDTSHSGNRRGGGRTSASATNAFFFRSVTCANCGTCALPFTDQPHVKKL